MERVQSLEADLTEIGIQNLDILRKRDQPDDVVRDEQLLFLLHRHHIDPQVLRAALDSKYKDTGHVMFAAGPAEHCLDDKNKWHIPVYQSTKSGGVQRGYRVFTLVARENKRHGKTCEQMWLWEGDTNVLGVPDEVVSARLLS